MTRDIVVGLDLGTSGLKGLAVTTAGEVVAEATLSYPTRRDEPGQAEQAPADWWDALAGVVERLRAVAPAEAWAAVGLAAMIPTLVVCDDGGEPVGAAVTWEDARARAEGDALRAAAGRLLGDESDGLYRRTGQWVDGRYLLPMSARLRAAGDRPPWTRVLGAKDHLFHRLTGEIATDPSTATGFGAYDLASGSWMPEALEAAGLPADPAHLPAVLPSTTTRALSPVAARRLGLPAGLPVCLGAADSVLAGLALGATDTGDVAYVTGTSTVILGIAASPATDPTHRYLVTPLADGAGWALEMDLVSTGSAVRWLADLLGLGENGEQQLVELAAKATSEARGVHVLPFLGGGEQGALWDEQLRGTVLGLDLASGPRELARALLDGIILESRRCLDALAAAGVGSGPVRAAGRGVASPFVRRQLADATGREVLFADVPSPSALGAALLAARAVGAVGADGSWAWATEKTRPDEATRPEWDERWRRHAAVVARVQALYRELPETLA